MWSFLSSSSLFLKTASSSVVLQLFCVCVSWIYFCIHLHPWGDTKMGEFSSRCTSPAQNQPLSLVKEGNCATWIFYLKINDTFAAPQLNKMYPQRAAKKSCNFFWPGYYRGWDLIVVCWFYNCAAAGPSVAQWGLGSKPVWAAFAHRWWAELPPAQRDPDAAAAIALVCSVCVGMTWMGLGNRNKSPAQHSRDGEVVA